MDRETVITHLQIIHTWAEFALERDLQFFTPKHLEKIAQWTDDALKLLKEQEETKTIICQKCGDEIEIKWSLLIKLGMEAITQLNKQNCVG